jgi:hypothetical protein
MIEDKHLCSLKCELESLGLESPRLNELNDSYEVENLVDNLNAIRGVQIDVLIH